MWPLKPYNECETSCYICESLYKAKLFGLQSVVVNCSCANCERALESTPYQTTKFWTGPNWRHNFADDKINVIEKLKFVLERVDNVVGKGENAGYQHFLLFLQFFQIKGLFFKVVKSRDCVVKS